MSCKIEGIPSDKHQQMSFPSESVLIVSHKYDMLTVVHLESSLLTETRYLADLVQIAGLLEPHATWSSTQQEVSVEECASSLLHMPMWLEVNYIFLRTSQFVFLSSSPTHPHKKVIVPETPQLGSSRSESGRTTGSSSNMPPIETGL